MASAPETSLRPRREIWRWVARGVAVIPLIWVSAWIISLYIPFGRQCMEAPETPAIPIFDSSPLWTPFAYTLWRLRRNAKKVLPRWVPMISYVVLLLVVAVAIPGNWRSVIGTNQSAAITSLRTLNAAEASYAETYDAGYTSRLEMLGRMSPSAGPSALRANLIDSALSGGKKRGYTFTYTPGPLDSIGEIKSYTVVARPLDASCGIASYFTDESGKIRHTTENRPATAKDSPISDFP